MINKNINNQAKQYSLMEESDLVSEIQIPLLFKEPDVNYGENRYRVLSLFSGCGGMELGFFATPRRSWTMRPPLFALPCCLLQHPPRSSFGKSIKCLIRSVLG